MPEITPNATAGRAMRGALGESVIDIDSDELRGLARELQAHADNMRPLVTASNQIGETAVQEAQRFTTDHMPAPVYASTVTSLDRVSGKFSGEIEKVIAQLESDASALMWIADANESTQDEAAKNIEAIDTGLGGASDAKVQFVSGGGVSPFSPFGQWDDDGWFDHESRVIESFGPGQAIAGNSGIGTAPV